jgi:hypothetical protein
MKSVTIKSISAVTTLMIPFIMVWVTAKKYIPPHQVGGLSVIAILFMMLGLVLYFSADKLGNS